ncbi:MAG: aminopeptidase P family protein [Candidatus Liptonbacteria bacterium]|nr:aminopeptidase P family protein [Candidatus Liptonbacteria bacterium]
MPKLIYASTKNRDLFYALKIEVSDPVFFLESGGRKYVFLDAREFGIFSEQNENRAMEAVPLEPLLTEISKADGNMEIANKTALHLLKTYCERSEAVSVPEDFPLSMADFLRAKGISLTVQNPFYPERAVKNSDEISLMKEAAKRTMKIFEKIEEILKEAAIEGEYIKYNGEILTSELLKKETAMEMARQELIDSEGIIISSGQHSAIPHHPGTGLIKAGSPIVCDIFPKSKISGYFSDISRTYVKGVPSKEISAMFNAVLRAQEAGIKKVRAGVPAKEIHNACAASLKESGFETSEKGGFMHSAGHGVGLEVHERPTVGPNSKAILETGNIITIEPGLYYPEFGGVRIEDMFLVTETGAICLTEYTRKLVIN